MRRLCLLLGVLAGALCVVPASRAETEIPFLSGRVNDTAGLLSEETVERLQKLLKAHEDSTSNQVVVLTIPSLEGEPLEEYSIRVVDTWKLGQKGKDNGVLLLVSRDDRKVRIEVGRGLEGDLPDITCGTIIRREIIPHFKQGDYNAGISAGVEAILSAIRGSYTAQGGAESENAGLGVKVLAGGMFLFIVGIFTTIALFARGAQGWFLYLFLLPFWAMFPWAILGAVGGAIAFGLYAVLLPVMRILLSKTAQGQKVRNRFSALPFIPTASGGGWTSGSSSSFSSSSDSFSGGGGGFSGGGASGSW